MKVMMFALFGLFVYAQSDAIGKVESSFDKKANFAALRTYSWAGGARAYNEEAHRLVVAAFEKEMTALGFKQVTSGADVMLSVLQRHVDGRRPEEARRGHARRKRGADENARPHDDCDACARDARRTLVRDHPRVRRARPAGRHRSACRRAPVCDLPWQEAELIAGSA